MCGLDGIIPVVHLRYHLTILLDVETYELLNLYHCKKWDDSTFGMAKQCFARKISGLHRIILSANLRYEIIGFLDVHNDEVLDFWLQYVVDCQAYDGFN